MFCLIFAQPPKTILIELRFFADQIRHFESQFGNMDDLLLSFANNVKTTHVQPSSIKVQPRKRWDVYGSGIGTSDYGL
jgi:hypothetical protein